MHIPTPWTNAGRVISGALEIGAERWTYLDLDWLDSQHCLQMYYSSKHYSHLNPVKRIRLRTKRREAANWLYGSIQAMLEVREPYAKHFLAGRIPKKLFVL